ncbi:MAG: PHP domain-containing protein [Defluviitaleaceae bacterium]|nr:PHP domain-containing protein [Defluviitaleaceae bacterium]
MYADMHIHTCFSDGTQTPEAVAETAKNKGMSIISVCDHNTIGAYDRLRPACASQGLTLIQGVELSVEWEWGNESLHLLTYNFDPANEDILALIKQSQAEFDREDITLIKKMSEEYPNISIADYETYERPAGRGGWKFINYVYDRGFSDDLLDGRKYYKQYGRPMKFEHIKIACEVIRNAGGVPVLAHPGMYWQESELPDKFQKLLAAGVGGLECYYPAHNESFTAKCVDFCKANDLCITCGCDGHGDFAQDIRGVFCDIGVLKTDVSLLNLKGIA